MTRQSAKGYDSKPWAVTIITFCRVKMFEKSTFVQLECIFATRTFFSFPAPIDPLSYPLAPSSPLLQCVTLGGGVSSRWGLHCYMTLNDINGPLIPFCFHNSHAVKSGIKKSALWHHLLRNGAYGKWMSMSKELYYHTSGWVAVMTCWIHPSSYRMAKLFHFLLYPKEYPTERFVYWKAV